MEKEFKLKGLNKTANVCGAVIEHFHTDADYARCLVAGTKEHQHALFDFFKGGETFAGYSALISYEKETSFGLPIDGIVQKIIPPKQKEA